MNKIVQSKLDRIHQGGRPRVVDLFAGCGGISLGFETAGCEIVSEIEWDRDAALTHALNFHGTPEDERRLHAVARDITRTDATELVAEQFPDLAVDKVADVVVGGPPCQAFARVGRAKLREVAAHPEAFRVDPRSNLYLRYLQFVEQMRPLAVLMENVPDALNYGGHNIAEEVAESLEELGYEVQYTLLNSVYYGVPQMRERMFLVGLLDGLGPLTFPAATHYVDLPSGYQGTRAVALKHVTPGLFTETHFVAPPKPIPSLRPAITAREALGDLPKITAHLEGRMPRGTRRFTTLSRYRGDVEPSAYARRMRKWPRFESETGVLDHVIRSLPRDYQIFTRMPHGGQYPEAHVTALTLFQEELESRRAAGLELRPGSDGYVELHRSIVPPYDPSKFPNKWRKMESDRPARTLMAHLGKDSYSHIHYDSEQARTISVREAARLQSFPDGFVFCGTMNPAFRQIGNAVPPLLAQAVAEAMVVALRARTARAEEQSVVAVA